MRLRILMLLLCAGVVWAAPDSLVVNVGGLQSASAIWWPTAKPVQASNRNVIVWFHGGMTSSNCAKGYVAGGDFAKLYPRAVVVSASACRENHWWTSSMMEVVDALLDSVAARRQAPVNAVSLVGISDGAIGVFAYSSLGVRKVNERLLMSSNGGLLGAPEHLAMQSKLRSGRWRFVQGGADRLYPATETVPWIESFCRKLGTDCLLRFDPSGEHDWSYWREKRLDWVREAISEK